MYDSISGEGFLGDNNGIKLNSIAVPFIGRALYYICKKSLYQQILHIKQPC